MAKRKIKGDKVMDYFDTNIMLESDPYEDIPTNEQIEARNRQIELEQDPFEVVYADTYRKAG